MGDFRSNIGQREKSMQMFWLYDADHGYIEMTMEMVIFLDDDEDYEKNCEDVNSTFPAQLPPSQST